MTRTLPLLLLLAGCPIGNDKYPKPGDLPDSWLVDRVRILGVAPEPPEVAPGESVTFTALLADPLGDVQTVLWLACDDGGSFGCNPDLAALPENPTREDLEALGIIGVEPGIPPVYVPDVSLLEGLTEEEARNGVEVTVQVLAIPAFEEGQDTSTIDFNAVEAAFKRLIVSTESDPNRSPVIEQVVVNGTPIPAGASVEIDPGLEYPVTVALEPESIQRYAYTNTEGVVEDRVEEPYVTLYATGGTLTESYGLYDGDDPILRGPRWMAPSDSGAEGTLYLVVRDRRGGMAWAAQSYVVR